MFKIEKLNTRELPKGPFFLKMYFVFPGESNLNPEDGVGQNKRLPTIQTSFYLTFLIVLSWYLLLTERVFLAYINTVLILYKY